MKPIAAVVPAALGTLGCVLAWTCGQPAAFAQQAFPSKPLRVVIPWPPGGANDIAGRTVMLRVADAIGQPVVIDNRGGAGGTIGTDHVAKSAPDGYTLLVQSVTHVANAHLYQKLPYDTLRDFAPVALLTAQTAVLVVHPSLPVKSVKEFVALARARPDQLMYSTAGNGSIPHLSMALFGSMTGTKLVHVPYKGGGPQVVGELVPEVFQGILDARARGGETVGMSTGFKAVDQWHLGLHVTDLIVLAARPAMGKSAFALNLAFNVARNRRRKAQDDYDRARVAVFSLEMGREQLVLRLLSARSGVGLTMLRKGELSPDDEMQLREAAAELAEMAIYLDDTPGLTPGDLRARCKRMEMHGPLDLVVVDYLQLMRGSGGAKQSREQEVAEISRSLKGLAKELQCTVIALSQLNRGLESRADKRPMMSDLRESGSIEQDADIIWFIHREHYYNASAPPHEAELVIAKQRAGATGIIKLHFDGPLTRFGNLDDRANDEWVGGH